MYSFALIRKPFFDRTSNKAEKSIYKEVVLIVEEREKKLREWAQANTRKVLCINERIKANKKNNGMTH